MRISLINAGMQLAKILWTQQAQPEYKLASSSKLQASSHNLIRRPDLLQERNAKNSIQ